MTQLRMVLRYSLLAVVIAACAGSPTSPELEMPSALTPPATAGPGSDTAKPLPPIDVRLEFAPAALTVGTPFTVTATITAKAPAPTVTGELAATGIAVVEQEATGHWQQLSSGQAVVTHAQARLTGCGEGAIRATVNVADDAGQQLYGRSTVVYVLAMDNVVLTGTAGPLLLRLEYLDQQLRVGALTPDEYERARDRVLGGGALQNGSPVPSDVPLLGPCWPR